jgi:hypothetical protein
MMPEHRGIAVGALRKVAVAVEEGPRAGAAGWRWRGSLVVEHGFAWRLDGEGEWPALGAHRPPLPTDKALVDAYKQGLRRAQALAFKRDLPMFLVYCDFEMAQK